MMLNKTLIVLFFILLTTLSPLFGETFTVSSLTGGTNANGLYAAIAGVNASSDPTNTILFSINGTIDLTASLPSIASPVLIDGFSAPTWSNVPVVSINFNNTPGFLFAKGSDNSTLEGLSLVNASSAGITLQSSSNKFYGNFVGLSLDGVTAIPNKEGGMIIESTSSNNLLNYTYNLGATNISYYRTTNPIVYPGSLWQGLRGSSTTNAYLSTTNAYLFTGTSDTNGILFIGNIEGTAGTNFFVNNPNFSRSTSVYGPDILGERLILVGSGTTMTSSVTYGFIFQGTTNDFNNAANYTTVYWSNSSYNYVHSTMQGLAVGNADNTNLVTGDSAYVYNIASSQFVTPIIYPASLTDSAYGIWWNGGTSYTICGGYSDVAYTHLTNQNKPYGNAFLVDYDSSKTGNDAFSHWTTFYYHANTNYVSHFEGISSVYSGVYTLAAASAVSATNPTIIASFVIVPRQADGAFGASTWIDINYPLTDSVSIGTSVYGYNFTGITFPNAGADFGYQSVLAVLGVFNNFSNNVGSGLLLKSTPVNFIGSCIFDSNTAFGVMATGPCLNTTITGSSVNDNGLGAYYLMHAIGITVY